MSEKTLAARLHDELDETVLKAVDAYKARRAAERAAGEAREAHLALLDRAVNLRRASLSLDGTEPHTAAMEDLHANRWIDTRAQSLSDQRIDGVGAWPR